MPVTKTDWSKPASDPVNRGGGSSRGQSAAAQRYQAMADYYRPSTASGTVFAGGSPAKKQSQISAPAPRTEQEQAVYDDALLRAQRELERQQAAATAAAIQANIDAAIAQRQREEEQRQAMLVGTPAMGFTDQMMAGGVSPGLFYARYGKNAPAVMEYLGQTIPGGPVQGALGALGFKTAKQHLATGTGQPVMDATGRVRGTLSTGPFGGVVYSGTRIPGYEGEYADLIRPASESGIRVGYNEDDDRPEITGTVQDPMTGQEKCPDGYIFDEDLQACRLAPMERTVADTTPGEAYARMGLLDVAPEGLMGFRERYGAGFGTPMDFGAANLAFRRQGATYPEYFQTAPKLDGYTLLA